MCKYQYKNRKKINNCIYPKLYEERGIHLPVDKEGFCLFHSQNLSWKENEQFEQTLAELINYLDEHPQDKAYESNLSGFIFIEGKYPDLLSDRIFKHRLNFSNCKFHNALRIQKSEIAGIDFSNTVFLQMPVFRNVKFSGGFYAKNADFQNGLHIEDCIFTRHTYFEESNFQNKANSKTVNVILKNVVFEESLSFRKSIIEVMLSMVQVKLQETEFTEAALFKECFLEEVTINKTMLFDKTEFHYTEIIGGYYSSVDFQKIHLPQTGKIVFRGKKPFYDQVKGELYIGFANPPAGTILFENFNLNKLENKSKLQLLELEKSEIVKVGAGCRKYKNQTQPKKIELNRGNQGLVTELTNTFVEFFINKNGINLGVEVIGREESYLEIIYFSDEDISEKRFLEMLKVSEIEMWRLVKVHRQSVQVNTPPKEKLPSKVIAGTDVIIDLVGLLLKIGVRVPLGQFNRKEFGELLSSTAFGGVPMIDYTSLETLNINQTILLGIGNKQNINLK